MSADSSCSAIVENAFGPAVAETCLDGFDFTLLFEETILTILPLALFSIWALYRLYSLRLSSQKASRSWLLLSKTMAYSALLALQMAVLSLWVSGDNFRTRATLAVLVLQGFLPIFLWILSYQEHCKTIRPSTILSCYLLLVLLLDLARTRTLFFIPISQSIASCNLAAYLVRVVILCLEIYPKREFIQSEWRDPAPEASSGILSRALFLWVNKLLITGYRSSLNLESLPAIDLDLCAASRPDKLSGEWEKTQEQGVHKNSLLWLFVRHYRWNLLSGVVPRLCYAALLFAQPFLVNTVLDYVDTPSADRSANVGYGVIGAYALVYVGLAVTLALYQHRTYRVLTEFRGSLITLIYAKTLRVNCTGASNAKAITLMSADIDRIAMAMHFIHETYASVIEIGLAIWLLYRFIGVAVAAVVAWFTVILAIGFPVSTAAGNAQVPWLEAIEGRLAATTKALDNVKSVRMAGLTEFASSCIRNLRRAEIRASRRYRFLAALSTVTGYLPATFGPVWCFGVYILLARAHSSQTLTPGIAFSTLTLIELTNQPATYLLSAVEDIRIIVNSFRRIQKYLIGFEQTGHALISSAQDVASRNHDGIVSLSKPEKELEWTEKDSGANLAPPAVIARNASCSPTQNAALLFKPLNFHIPRGQITVLEGPVGSGKSTLLKLIIGEAARATPGSITLNSATRAYCPQTPWLIQGSVKDNIVGSSEWDSAWYKTVVEACALQDDFDALPDGDQTMTGSRGSGLSGGQQARVCLARALFSKSSLMILDSVLSGLDAITKSVILHRVFGSNGLLRRLGSTTIIATNSELLPGYGDHVLALDGKGHISGNNAGSDSSKTLETPSIGSGCSDLNYRLEENGAQSTSSESSDGEEEEEDTALPQDSSEELSRRTGDLKIYAYYFRIVGFTFMVLYLITALAYVFGTFFPTIWLQWWTNANVTHPNQNIGYWLGTYGALSAIAVSACFASEAVFMLVIVPKTAFALHESLLMTTFRATTSYLTATGVGAITNRFSQDLELVDNDLPQALDLFTLSLMSTIASTALVFVGSSYVAAAIPGCLLVVYVVQTFYLRTSRQLRLIDIEARAPLFSHFLETINGLSSIRTYGWTMQYHQKHLKALDDSQKPYYLLWCIQRWLTLVLDLIIAGLAIMLVALATSLPSGETGLLGVALVNIVGLGSDLQGLVTQWTQLETAVGAVNRIRAYVTLTPLERGDDAKTSLAPRSEWPEAGNIVFNNVSCSYTSDGGRIVSGINLAVKKGERIAICGRTGSGKSSLVCSLLGMTVIREGDIVIDGQSLTTMDSEIVRERLNVLPQDPAIVHGTLRENLNPSASSSDQSIHGALSSVGLDHLLVTEAGLDTNIDDLGFSHGQRQLLCLARAMLKSSSILVLDEATSGLDRETDEKIQAVLRQHFANSTILAVAHKLETILDFDRVVVMSEGRIVETGIPRRLLAQKGSRFSDLYYSTRGREIEGEHEGQR